MNSTETKFKKLRKKMYVTSFLPLPTPRDQPWYFHYPSLPPKPHVINGHPFTKRKYLQALDVIFFSRSSRRESEALSRRMPWAKCLFSKSMKGKILNFLHEVEKMISIISVHVQLKKLDLFKKIDLTFKRQK